ncbi:unnamed protein product [Cylicocyclus nassatus]|uniref:Uncharacterized protein n=1 Tax=Cylicocyclus nassatus TaxID=53992 RepID=A0AA36GXS9_CYLNA|nr:unnamed protein product [Cylicocyclus nassatus]CAJ0600117.1 unnamed protein product [Cylicocyclus nassatus]
MYEAAGKEVAQFEPDFFGDAKWLAKNCRLTLDVNLIETDAMLQDPQLIATLNSQLKKKKKPARKNAPVSVAPNNSAVS